MALQPFGAMSGGGGPPPEALAHMAGFMVAAMRSWGTPVASLANLKGAAQGVTTASSKKRPPPDDAPENSSEGQGKKKRNRWQKKKKAEKEPAADGSGQQQGGQPTDPASTMEVDAPASSNAQPDDPPEPVERPLGPENKGSENAG
ncbi:MAG: hypothetical protein LQ346_004576 [Caloplaca aetnensis]|nr:MAG: hypothetical protein LQ346_004576 [Caloplaca aetnensis]